jgi:antitoxin ParD1/3/4
MTITLPDELRDELERKARAAGFDTVAEYVCWLVREADTADATPQDLGYASEAELEAKLLASLDSGPPIPITPAFWEECRARAATGS